MNTPPISLNTINFNKFDAELKKLKENINKLLTNPDDIVVEQVSSHGSSFWVNGVAYYTGRPYFKAFFKNNPKKFACGNTEKTAVAKLLEVHPRFT